MSQSLRRFMLALAVFLLISAPTMFPTVAYAEVVWDLPYCELLQVCPDQNYKDDACGVAYEDGIAELGGACYEGGTQGPCEGLDDDWLGWWCGIVE